MKKIIYITGMTCSACSNFINKHMSNLNGVSYVNVNLVNKKMTIEFNESQITLKEIEKEIKKIGYGTSKSESTESYKNRLLYSITLTIILVLVMFSLKLNINILINNNLKLNFSIQLLITTVIIIINYKYYIKGFKGLIKLSPNMESLISVSTISSYIYNVYLLIKVFIGYSNEIDFMSIGMILSIITIGKFIQSRSLLRTNKAIETLVNLVPTKVTILVNGEEENVSIDDVKINDLVVIKSGNVIPVDGIVETGFGYIDESIITGEALYIEKTKGDKVLKSTINKEGNFIVKASVNSEDTLYNKILLLMEEASSNKSKVSQIVDKISRIFVPFVILLSILSFSIWMIIGESFDFALSIASSVLVVSCPCALGLATPTALVVSIYKAVSMNILIKNSECLETLSKIKTVLLDKTGTITIGKMSVIKIVNNEIDYNDFINIIYSIENKSNHPISKSICSEIKEKENIVYKEITDFVDVFGKGLLGKLNDKVVIAGNKRLMLENNVEIHFNSLDDNSNTIVYFAYDNKFIGYVVLNDEIKETSINAIEKLKNMNLIVKMITGDHKNNALNVNEKLNLDDVYYEVLPDEKDKLVIENANHGKVCFVGDGINDSVALTRADVGIAMGNSSDVAIESSDAILMRNELIDIVRLIKLSHLTIRIIKENLFFAFIYNIILIPIACGIFINYGIMINATISSFAMSLSSICVVLNALRINKFK